MKITPKDFSDYVLSWLSTEVSDRGNCTITNMRAALKNSLAMLTDDQDGIIAEKRRKETNKE
jgi:hypothetical protein